MKRTHLAYLVACGLMSGCGGAPQQAPMSAPYSGAEAQSQPQTQQQYPGSTGTAQQQPGYGAAADKDAPGQVPSPKAGAVAPRKGEERGYAQPPPSLDQTVSMSRSMRMLADDFVVAESAMLTAGHDCTSACRALRSMQRAAARLCSIATNDDEREVCRRAQDRVRGARERVRSSCGQCTGGPSLEPNAPIEE